MKTLDTPYDELSKIVNEIYEENASIGETMKETGLPFDIVWDCLGFKDYFDFKETEWQD